MPEDYDTRDPEHKSIYRFIRTLFNAAQLTAECAIVTLVSTMTLHGSVAIATFSLGVNCTMAVLEKKVHLKHWDTILKMQLILWFIFIVYRKS